MCLLQGGKAKAESKAETKSTLKEMNPWPAYIQVSYHLVHIFLDIHSLGPFH